jgi:hypothetical protein
LIKVGGTCWTTMCPGAGSAGNFIEAKTVANRGGARRRQADVPFSGGAAGGKPVHRWLRVTTPEVLDAVLKVFAGTVNHQFVASLVAAGGRAVDSPELTPV